MSQLALFLFGCLVTMVVASAVGLLMWGAANEPEDGELPSSAKASSSGKASPDPAPARESTQLS